MSKLSMKTTVAAPAAKVWGKMGGFNALADWHPAVEKSTLENGGKRRRLSLAGGGEIIEDQVEHDDGGRRYSYTIVTSPLPVSNYRSSIVVTEGKDGTATVEWSGEFDPVGPEDKAVEVMRGVYGAGLDNLKKMFGG